MPFKQGDAYALLVSVKIVELRQDLNRFHILSQFNWLWVVNSISLLSTTASIFVLFFVFFVDFYTLLSNFFTDFEKVQHSFFIPVLFTGRGGLEHTVH